MKNEFIFHRFSIVILFLIGIVICACENVKTKKSIDENDNAENNEESLDIAVESDSAENVTCARRQNSRMHEIYNAKHNEFPYIAAVMSHQNEYLCSGSIISKGLVLTTAKCTQQPISYLMLNTTSDKKENAVLLHVIKTEKFPTFTGSDSMKDVGIIYTEKHNTSVATKIVLSNYTSPRKLSDIEALGFGLNAEVGEPKLLQYVGLERRATLDSGDIIKGYFDCVETKIPTCFKDTGGPAIFDNELIGIVIKGQEECTREMTSAYAINKRMVDILPTFTFKAWLDEKIQKNEELDNSPLAAYPEKPTYRANTEPPPVQMVKAEEPPKWANSQSKTKFSFMLTGLCFAMSVI